MKVDDGQVDLRERLQAVDLNPYDGAGYRIRCLQAHFDRSVRESGLEVGTRCRLRETIRIDKSSGWWASRYTLTKGREGVVREVFARPETGRLYCYWLPDIECIETSTYGIAPKGTKPWFRAITGEGRYTYAIALDELEPVLADG